MYVKNAPKVRNFVRVMVACVACVCVCVRETSVPTHQQRVEQTAAAVRRKRTTLHNTHAPSTLAWHLLNIENATRRPAVTFNLGQNH